MVGVGGLYGGLVVVTVLVRGLVNGVIVATTLLMINAVIIPFT